MSRFIRKWVVSYYTKLFAYTWAYAMIKKYRIDLFRRDRKGIVCLSRLKGQSFICLDGKLAKESMCATIMNAEPHSLLRFLFLDSEPARLLSPGTVHSCEMMQRCNHELTLKHATGIETPSWRYLEASAEEQDAKMKGSLTFRTSFLKP